jgi:hypothetical protein
MLGQGRGMQELVKPVEPEIEQLIRDTVHIHQGARRLSVVSVRADLDDDGNATIVVELEHGADWMPAPISSVNSFLHLRDELRRRGEYHIPSLRFRICDKGALLTPVAGSRP